MSRPLRSRGRPGRRAHTGPLTVFRVMSADDHVHPGSVYMHTDELTDPEIGHVGGSLHTWRLEFQTNSVTSALTYASVA